MFFKPTLALNAHTGSPYDLYSDWHKDAFGCRPGAVQSARYDAMSVEQRQVEHATVGAWMEEDQRISELRAEVARFDFSRRMEYLMRREGISERDAFAITCNHDRAGDPREVNVDWGMICYVWNLPYSDEKALADKWAELNA